MVKWGRGFMYGLVESLDPVMLVKAWSVVVFISRCFIVKKGVLIKRAE
jgi:hypothetical protein